MKDLFNTPFVALPLVFFIAMLPLTIKSTADLLEIKAKYYSNKPVPIFTNEQAADAMDCLAERGE